MRMLVKGFAAAVIAPLAMALAPAQAEVLTFAGPLDGAQEVAPGDDDATGFGTVVIDTVAETVSFDLTVAGLSLADLNTGLSNGPLGPVHLHNAPAGQNGPIIVPFPFGATYTETADGFNLSVSNVSFADAVGISGATLSFTDFVSALLSDNIYINVHSNEFPAGAIRGQLFAVVADVPIPGAALLFLSGIAGAAGLRRKKAA